MFYLISDFRVNKILNFGGFIRCTVNKTTHKSCKGKAYIFRSLRDPSKVRKFYENGLKIY